MNITTRSSPSCWWYSMKARKRRLERPAPSGDFRGQRAGPKRGAYWAAPCLLRAEYTALFRPASSVQTSGHMQRFAGDVRSIVRREESHCRRNLLDLADPPERRDRFDPVAHVAFGHPCGNDAFGGDHAGIDGIDADLARRQFL